MQQIRNTTATLRRAWPRPRITGSRVSRHWPRRGAWIATALALALAGLPLAAQGGSSSASAALAVAGMFEQVAILVGFGIERVSVSGHVMTHDADIFAALHFKNLRSMAEIDGRAARERIERLPWIETARVRRVFPNAVDVRVTERHALAIWRHDGSDLLIDRRGRVLSPVTPGSAPHLPLVAGDGAAPEAASFLAVLDRYAGLRDRVARAERVAGRRWTLHLENGSIVHLPADRESAALDAATRPGGIGAALARGDVVLDLRVPGRSALRLRADRSPMEESS